MGLCLSGVLSDGVWPEWGFAQWGFALDSTVPCIQLAIGENHRLSLFKYKKCVFLFEYDSANGFGQ